jgi:hypothetical protein
MIVLRPGIDCPSRLHESMRRHWIFILLFLLGIFFPQRAYILSTHGHPCWRRIFVLREYLLL